VLLAAAAAPCAAKFRPDSEPRAPGRCGGGVWLRERPSELEPTSPRMSTATFNPRVTTGRPSEGPSPLAAAVGIAPDSVGLGCSHCPTA
jgi:hypothetical protein